MLRKLLRAARAPARATGEVPAGQRVYAIGDIHGRREALTTLLAMIEADDAARGAAQTTLVFLGDLMDRGPDSAGVVDDLLRLRATRPATRFIAGNHEELFLGVIRGSEKAVRLFCRVGGRETTLSYGLSASDYERMDHAELSAWLAANVPAAHVDFLGSFESSVAIGRYLMVHAGVHPDRPLDQQCDSDLRWIREPFLSHDKPLGAVIVHGHTITDAVEYRPHRIGIDTGAYLPEGRLTALGMEGAETWELTAR